MKRFRSALLLFIVSFLTAVFVHRPIFSQTPARYQSMSAEQRRSFAKSEVEELIGIGPNGAITSKGIDQVITEIDGYLARKPMSAGTGCRMGADLSTIFQRAQPHVDTIRTSFELPQLPPDLGIYVAMIESEFCPCIQSPTGPLGMFQWTALTARNFGIDAISGASPARPDERCDPRMASRGAATYFSQLIRKDFPDDPQEFLLAVAAYNIGEGGLKRVRKEAAAALKNQRLGFWEISDFVVNKRAAWVEEKRKAATGDEEKDADLPRVNEHLAFRSETLKYVPRFLAAAIIGRNPGVFGISGEALGKKPN